MGNDVKVVEKDDRTLTPIATEAGPDRPPAWRRLKDLVFDPLPPADFAKETGRGDLVSGRVGRIDPQIGEKEVERLGLDPGPVDLARRSLPCLVPVLTVSRPGSEEQQAEAEKRRSPDAPPPPSLAETPGIA